ncbi:ATP-binding cassette domain-containing protein [Pedobacter sp. Du54]|uniref:ATP-binding cassette domain-containing protein n=1 Tax=Pedobacter anseongensis TaxID=3133439 RepID=UPI0030ABEB2A
MSALIADSITKDFGLRQVLTDVFITMRPGEIIGLLGRNGSGKSTLMKIIFGTLKANHKYIKVDDVCVKTVSDSKYLIQYLAQDNFLPTHISIEKIIKVFCDLKNAAILFEKAQIKPFLSVKSNELSSGERRLIEIFLILYGKSKYILLDEPFNGLAPLPIGIIKEEIKLMAKEKGILISDHDYINVLEVSTSLILLRDGAVKKIRNHQELIDFGYLPVHYVPNSMPQIS